MPCPQPDLRQANIPCRPIYLVANSLQLQIRGGFSRARAAACERCMALVGPVTEGIPMRLCRFDNGKYGVVRDETIHDVSGIVERIVRRAPPGRGDPVIA